MTKIFEVEAMETRVYDVLYIVEAEDKEEAKKKAEEGDVFIAEGRVREVIDRNVWKVRD